MQRSPFCPVRRAGSTSARGSSGPQELEAELEAGLEPELRRIHLPCLHWGSNPVQMSQTRKPSRILRRKSPRPRHPTVVPHGGRKPSAKVHRHCREAETLQLKHPTILPSLADKGFKRDGSIESLRFQLGWRFLVPGITSTRNRGRL